MEMTSAIVTYVTILLQLDITIAEPMARVRLNSTLSDNVTSLV